MKLWFDVGIKRYTTFSATSPTTNGLWFDVGFKRYSSPDKVRGGLPKHQRYPIEKERNVPYRDLGNLH